MTDERKNKIWAMLDEQCRNIAKDVYLRGNPKVTWAIEQFFGLHNLTAQAGEKPKEPKFNIGDKVRISCQYANGEIWDPVMHNRIATIKDYYYKDDVNMCVFEENYRDFGEAWLEPYIDKPSQKNPLDVAESVNPPKSVGLDYAQYRFDLAKEIAVAMIPDGWNMEIANRVVGLANEIVKRLKETEE